MNYINKLRKNTIFLIIIGISIIYGVYNINAYAEKKVYLEYKIKIKTKKLSNTVKILLDESIEKYFYIEEIFYEKIFLDFKYTKFSKNNSVKLDKNFKIIFGDNKIPIFKDRLKEILDNGILVVEYYNDSSSIYLAGEKGDYIIIKRYPKPQELIKNISLNKILSNIIKGGETKKIEILDNSNKIFIKIGNVDKNLKIIKTISNLKIDDKLNNLIYNYKMVLYMNFTNDYKEINRGLINLIFNLFVIIVVVIFMVIYNIHQKRLLEAQNYIKEKEKDILLGGMASMVAHEIRNPINTINYSIEYLKKIAENEKIKKYIEIMSKEVFRINRIIEEFLALRKNLNLNKKELNLNELIKEIYEFMKPQFEEKEVNVIFENRENLIVIGDKDKLKEVLINLIRNSLEALDKRDFKEVKIKVDKKGILIKDNGIGMDKEELENLFKLYYTTKSMGNGIGMFVVKKIIDAHNWGIDVKSEKNIGTEIFIEVK
ncbi:sensor histidine kinase [Haliovirga abyssi]|uniref:histidine kinase n=1 Tax=Haliovirga abyssi TaxID=2996794 RepID=A0AAU9DRU8_9FUSO|nr:HAMP domain-containing sensor histidine kinase [Haliovirga abyssi]BDU51328.1 hypothetical protein HLVA_18970 [Haliovirga abyssi]